jgi:hydrogenase 3 maturation protease
LLREMAPEQVLLVDAADMDLAPGEVRLIDAGRIDDPFLMTTHTLPLTYLMESIREFVPKVDLLGVQPANVYFGYPISASVQEAVAHIYDRLAQDGRCGCDEIAWKRL